MFCLKTIRRSRLTITATIALNALTTAWAEDVLIEFDDPPLALSQESQWDGVDDTFNDGAGQANVFNSRGVEFNNNHQHESWGHAWQGWAYSNRTDTGTTGFAGQYTAMADPAGGHDGSSQFGVGFVGFSASPMINLGGPFEMEDVQITNNAYAHDSMANGDAFAKKFGGTSGDDPDWFLLTISGALNGVETGTVEFYLADYRFADNAEDYIIDDWTAVGLGALGIVDAVAFSLTSTDNGDFGMNTPAFFAMDSLSVTRLGGYADFDSDGDVDGDDFVAWQTGFGLPEATREQGDANSDGIVDGDDFLIWQSEFGGGGSATQAPNAAVPEPTAILIFVLLMLRALSPSRSTARGTLLG